MVVAGKLAVARLVRQRRRAAVHLNLHMRLVHARRDGAIEEALLLTEAALGGGGSQDGDEDVEHRVARAAAASGLDRARRSVEGLTSGGERVKGKSHGEAARVKFSSDAAMTGWTVGAWQVHPPKLLRRST